MTFHVLGYTVLLLLWASCTAQQAGCGPPPRRDREELTEQSNKETYSHGDIVIYICRPGYIKLGSIRFRCNNGNWVPAAPFVECRKRPCGHPGDLQFGSFVLVNENEFVFGARAVFQCDEGYQMLSQINYRDCRADGWSNDVPHCEVKKCFPVKEPKNGRIIMTGLQEVDQEFMFGQVVRFECAENFKIQGSAHIFCTNQGTWSAPEPTCIEITCQPGTIEHGSITSSNRIYKEREQLQFACNSGYKHAGRSDATCTKNGWNPQPMCTEIVCSLPEVGPGRFHPRQDQYRFEDVVQIQCDSGYQLDRGEETSTCTENGWSPSPRCVSKPCDYVRVVNGWLHNDHGGYYFPKRLRQTIYFSCNDGFLPAGGEDGYGWKLSTCTKLGWNPEPKCFKTCRVTTTDVPHGRFIQAYHRQYIEGEELSFSCDEGYYPENPEAKARCTKNGWTPTPQCAETPACKLVDPPHGYFYERQRKFALNERATYGCESGYTTPQGLERQEIKCLEEGWTPEPKCIKTCPKPAEENILINATKSVFLSEEKLVYECTDGYETTKKKTEDLIVCTENGWDPKPECLQIRCEHPNLVQGKFEPRTKDQFVHKDVVQFSCNKGYQRVGPASAQCYHFGWSPPPPVCKNQVSPCTAPPSISDGNITGELREEYSHGDKVEYVCQVSFALVGSGTIECIDGNWTSLPSCTVEEKTCEQPPNIRRGRVVSEERETYFHGDTASYECEEGFVLVGTNLAKCLHGKWNLPSCAPLCPPPPQLPNAIDITEIRNYADKEKIHFRCRQHFLLQGPKEITCERGQWQTPPRCIDGRCGDPPIIANGDVKNRTQHKYGPGESVEYHCHEGFEIRGLSSATCEKMRWSEPPSCKEKSCGEPPKVFNSSDVGRTRNTYNSGETFRYKCYPGFVADGPLTVTCQRGEWTEPPTCEEATCREPPTVDNADILNGPAAPYLPNQHVQYQCHEGFEISGSATIICVNKAWSKPPVCEDVACSPPITNANLSGRRKEKYLPLETVRFRCSLGQSLFGPPAATCRNKQWTELPKCEAAGGNCGRPPAIENGDYLEAANVQYPRGSVVHYKCQRHYVINGSAEVRCVNGHWTEPPICLVACTITEEEMESHNIQLRWRYNQKLYSESGEPVEFFCRRGYRLAPSSPPLRALCIEGNLEYPSCV
ncbi:complement factor H isoform X2 [Hemicordylus capensis]|uniref:complement factor H isoform X2 n=1 Tax=Hemicordylus capensis TaxID=884348 RepID=UPI00230427E5|nr:complement factor H isoform X2 [Hemicordylus capensis]